MKILPRYELWKMVRQRTTVLPILDPTQDAISRHGGREADRNLERHLQAPPAPFALAEASVIHARHLAEARAKD